MDPDLTPLTKLDEATAAAQLACMNLLVAYCHHIDSGHASRNVDLFTEDGSLIARMEVGENVDPAVDARGRLQLAAVFDERDRAVGRRTKHVSCNPRITFVSSDKGHGSSTTVMYLLSAQDPFSATVAHSITECEDVFLRGPLGEWRIASRSVRLVAGRL